MNKIKETESVLLSGARNNKYRVLFPQLGKEIDVQTHDVVSPGRSMGVSEVFLKGRKFQLAGDRADEGTMSLNFYNDPELNIRKFFLETVRQMQDFETPSGTGVYYGLQSGVDFFNEVQSNIGNFGGFSGIMNLGAGNLYYQFDIVIQQLDHQNKVVYSVTLHNAFITSVGDIEYQDEVGEVSMTSLEFAFTDTTVL